MDLALALSLSRSDDEISKERQSSLAFSPTAEAAAAATRMDITHGRAPEFLADRCDGQTGSTLAAHSGRQAVGKEIIEGKFSGQSAIIGRNVTSLARALGRRPNEWHSCCFCSVGCCLVAAMIIVAFAGNPVAAAAAGGFKGRRGDPPRRGVTRSQTTDPQGVRIEVTSEGLDLIELVLKKPTLSNVYLSFHLVINTEHNRNRSPLFSRRALGVKAWEKDTPKTHAVQ